MVSKNNKKKEQNPYFTREVVITLTWQTILVVLLAFFLLGQFRSANRATRINMDQGANNPVKMIETLDIYYHKSKIGGVFSTIRVYSLFDELIYGKYLESADGYKLYLRARYCAEEDKETNREAYTNFMQEAKYSENEALYEGWLNALENADNN